MELGISCFLRPNRACLVSTGNKMPINRLLKDSKLTLEEQAVLNRAFDRTLRKLHLVDRNDPICEIVARKVIEIGATGVTNPVAISEIAVRQLGPP
jgi:hypothetical protein